MQKGRLLNITTHTILVLKTGVGSALEQLQGALPLTTVGGAVQRSVTQQICAVDVWRPFLAELQKTHKTEMCRLDHNVW